MKIVELMDRHMGDLVLTPAMAKQVHAFQVNFILKDDHSILFGNVAIGLVNVFFRDQEEREFFDIFDIDAKAIVKEYPKAPAIFKERLVTGDVLNLVLFYLIYRFNTDKTLPRKVIEQAKHDLAIIFFSRTLAALNSKGFRYLADENIALATVEAMSDRYIIKQLGSWRKYLDYRADHLLNKKSLFYKTFKDMRDDDMYLYAISASQGALRGTWILIYGTYIKTKEMGSSIDTTSLVSKIDPNGTIVDVTNSVTTIVDKMLSIVLTTDDFVDDEVAAMVSRFFTGLVQRRFKEALVRISELSLNMKHRNKVNNFISQSVTVSYEYLRTTNALGSDIGEQINLIRGGISSGRASDTSIVELKKITESLMGVVFTNQGGKLMSTYRSALILYVFVRSKLR